MRKAMKIAAGVAIVCFLTGAVMTGIGLASGGKLSFMVDLAEQRVYTGSEALIKDELTTDPFSNIDVQGNTEDIEIILTEDRFGVEYSVLKKAPKITVEDDTLKIRKSSKRWGTFGIGGFGIDSKSYIKIYLPESIVPENVKIVTDTGDIRLDELVAASVKLDSDTGDVNVSKLTAEKVALSTDTGDVKVGLLEADEAYLESDTGDLYIQSGTLETAALETDTGDIRIEDTAVTSLTAESDTGDVKAGIRGRAKDYTMNCKSDTGNVKIEGSSQGNKYSSEGRSEKTIKAKTDTGNISIDFSIG